MIDDAHLIAWLDGELSPQAAGEIAAAVAADPNLAARAAAHRAVTERLRSAFNALLEPPMPQISIEVAQGDGEVLDLQRARGLRVAQGKSATRFGLPSWAGIAAMVPLVFAAGYAAHLAPPKGDLSDRDGRLVAAGELARALDTRLASSPSETPGPRAVRVLLSFRARDGHICRSWAAKGQAGIACHEGQVWTMAATAAAPQDSGQYRTAGSGDPGLLATMDAMVSQGPFDAVEEARLRAEHWR